MAKKKFPLFDFMDRFPDEQSCVTYLSSQKWSGGFTCSTCGFGKSKQGKKKCNHRCLHVGMKNHQQQTRCFIN